MALFRRRPHVPPAARLDEAMMRRALDLGLRAWRMDEVPVGAVVYRGEEVLGEGHNLRESAGDPTAHAEMIALREAARKVGGWRLQDCDLAVTLEPCPMCAGAIVNARISRLVYGAADPKMGAVRTLYRICEDRRLNHQPLVVPGVAAEECGELLRGFFRERRRKNKAARRAR